MEFLLERWAVNGGTYYVPFSSIAELDAYRNEHPEANGAIFTESGYLLNEDKLREVEK